MKSWKRTPAVRGRWCIRLDTTKPLQLTKSQLLPSFLHARHELLKRFVLPACSRLASWAFSRSLGPLNYQRLPRRPPAPWGSGRLCPWSLTSHTHGTLPSIRPKSEPSSGLQCQHFPRARTGRCRCLWCWHLKRAWARQTDRETSELPSVPCCHLPLSHR